MGSKFAKNRDLPLSYGQVKGLSGMYAQVCVDDGKIDERLKYGLSKLFIGAIYSYINDEKLKNNKLTQLDYSLRKKAFEEGELKVPAIIIKRLKSRNKETGELEPVKLSDMTYSERKPKTNRKVSKKKAKPANTVESNDKLDQLLTLVTNQQQAMADIADRLETVETVQACADDIS